MKKVKKVFITIEEIDGEKMNFSCEGEGVNSCEEMMGILELSKYYLFNKIQKDSKL